MCTHGVTCKYFHCVNFLLYSGGENFARTCKKFQQPEDVSVGATIGEAS